MSLDRVTEKLNDRLRKVYHSPQPLIYGGYYWYVLGFTKQKAKKVFWGPMGEEEANACLTELNEGEKFSLTTRDPHRAVREVRDILVKRGEKPDDVLKRLLHKRDADSDKSKEQPKQQGIVSKLFAGRYRPGAASTKGISRATPPPKFIVARVMKQGGA